MIAELLLKTFDKHDKPAVTFHPKRCLRSRLNSNTCEICLAHCSKKALMLSDKKIVFNEDRCTGCMRCAAECPNDAFGIDFNISDLLQHLASWNSQLPLTVRCHKASPTKKNYRIPCIGLLSEPVLAGLNCLASSDVYLDIQHCPDCENGHVINLLYERIQKVMKKIERPEEFKIRYQTVRQDLNEQPGEQRRAFLSLARKSMVNIGKDASSLLIPDTKQETKDTQPEKEAVRISRFLQQALDTLPSDADFERKLLCSYFYTSKTNERCDLCPLCTGMCPTGALKRETDGQAKQLHFSSVKCSGCGLCVDFCKKDALTIMPGAESDPGIVQAIA